MIELRELNDMLKDCLYTGNDRHENHGVWKDLSKRVFVGYENTPLGACLCKIGVESYVEVARLARLIEWEGKLVLNDMLEYVAEMVKEVVEE